MLLNLGSAIFYFETHAVNSFRSSCFWGITGYPDIIFRTKIIFIITTIYNMAGNFGIHNVTPFSFLSCPYYFITGFEISLFYKLVSNIMISPQKVVTQRLANYI